MPKTVILILKIAVVMTALMLAAFGILDVCNLISHEELKQVALRGLMVIGILTAASVVIAAVMSAGHTRV